MSRNLRSHRTAAGRIVAGVRDPAGAARHRERRRPHGLWLQENAGVTQPTFYVDDVHLEFAPPPALVNVAVNPKERIRKGKSIGACSASMPRFGMAPMPRRTPPRC